MELCLTVPVRLSALLPYLHYLMRPLVLALKSKTERVSQGLRTLELCIDNLSPEFLSPIIEPIRPELMGALWRHLQPSTVSNPRQPRHGPTTLRLLGKLGGRNRTVFKQPPALSPRSHKGPALRLALTLSDRDQMEDRSKVVFLAVDEGVTVAVGVLTTKENGSQRYRVEAFEFLQGTFAGMVNLEPLLDDSPQFNVAHAVQKVCASATSGRRHHPPKTRKGDGRDVLQTIISGIFIAAAREETKEKAQPFLEAVVRHCVMLSILKASEDTPASNAQPQPHTHRRLDPELVISALVICLSSNDPDDVKTTEPLLGLCLSVCVERLGSVEVASTLALFDAPSYELCACVYELEWHKKKAGCIGNPLPDGEHAKGLASWPAAQVCEGPGVCNHGSYQSDWVWCGRVCSRAHVRSVHQVLF